MSSKDKLIYFDIYGRAEPTRMLYAMAGQELDDVRVEEQKWPSIKNEYALGQLPVLETADGTISQSNTIARHAALKFGLVGDNLYEQALHDAVVESCMDMARNVAQKIYPWKVRQVVSPPEDSDKLVMEIKEKILKQLPYIESIAQQQGKRFIVGDSIGLAEIWFYCHQEFINKAFPDSMKMTPWIEKLVANMEADAAFKQYLTSRRPSVYGV